MNKVRIYCGAMNEGEFLFRGECFEENIWLELQILNSHSSENEQVKLLVLEVDKFKSNKHPQDILYSIFYNNVTLCFDFAKTLNLFDIIGPGCFYSDTEIGKAMIYLIECAELSFVVEAKYWSSPMELSIDFQASGNDTHLELQKILIKG